MILITPQTHSKTHMLHRPCFQYAERLADDLQMDCTNMVPLLYICIYYMEYICIYIYYSIVILRMRCYFRMHAEVLFSISIFFWNIYIYIYDVVH